MSFRPQPYRTKFDVLPRSPSDIRLWYIVTSQSCFNQDAEHHKPTTIWSTVSSFRQVKHTENLRTHKVSRAAARWKAAELVLSLRKVVTRAFTVLDSPCTVGNASAFLLATGARLTSGFRTAGGVPVVEAEAAVAPRCCEGSAPPPRARIFSRFLYIWQTAARVTPYSRANAAWGSPRATRSMMMRLSSCWR